MPSGRSSRFSSHMTLKEAAKRILGKRGTLLIRHLYRRRWRIRKHYQLALRGMRCLEIGGPTDILGSTGPLPLYSGLATIDNCNFAEQTIWSSDAVPYSRTFIVEGTALEIESNSYDCVIASHCLEHIANPIKALLEWRRVLRSDGLLLLILPHRDDTFDWRRAVTTIEHMKADYETDMPESDLTHLDEILLLHDLSRDPGAGTPEQFRNRCLNNMKFRAIHHHVFVPETALEILQEAGFSIVRQDVVKGNIITLAKRN
jgi:Methyltransferase domain